MRTKGIGQARDPALCQTHALIGDYPTMRGRDRFNSDEIAWIRDQLAELRVAEPADQKRIRAGLRREGFRISEWRDSTPFTASKFDALVASGQIICDDSVGGLPPGPRPIVDPAPTMPSRGRDSRLDGDGRSHVQVWVESQLPAALMALHAPRLHMIDAREQVPDVPGLYAMYADVVTWRQLGLGDPPDDRPLYVGKAEASLVTRDLNQHFADGNTGRSSPRRSYAALLVDDLELVARPRRWPNPEPKKFHCYALEPDGDERLTAWMLEHLRLAVWPCGAPMSLDALETAVLLELEPPLNLNKVGHPWRHQVRDVARKRLARDAEEWAKQRGWRP